jgi:opacity protein-like surface antigen
MQRMSSRASPLRATCRGSIAMSKLAGFLGLAVAVLAGPALADGYGRNVPAPIPVPAPMPIPDTFSYYLRGDIGWSFSGDPSFSESGAVYGTMPTGVPLSGRSVNTDGVFIGTVGAGAYWSPRFRTDITLDFRGDQSVDATAAYSDPPDTGKVRDTVRLRGTIALANAYWDILPRGHFTPYVGAGIGFVYNDIERSYLATETPSGTTVTGSSHDTHFGLAAALMAGVSIATDHRFVWDLSYRALYSDGGNTTTVLSNGSTSAVEIGSQWEHQVRVGIRANLW